MLWNDVATLINYTGDTKVTDDIGDTVKTPAEREVFVNKKDVRQSEFYQAKSTGLKPVLMLEVKSIDYEDEKDIKYNNKDYKIIRTYSRNGEVTELICEAVI